MDKPINLSWLVEKWTLTDEDSYLKNIWLNTESLDIIRINQGETEEDIVKNYIDIDSDIDNFVLMPDRASFDEDRVNDVFLGTMPRHERDQFIDEYEGFAPKEEFMDTIYALGLEEKYNDFRDKVAAYILLLWADEEKISIKKDIETINIDKL